MNDHLGFIALDTQRIRQLEDAELNNPPESGFRVLRRAPTTAADRVRLRYDAARTQVQDALTGEER